MSSVNRGKTGAVADFEPPLDPFPAAAASGDVVMSLPPAADDADLRWVNEVEGFEPFVVDDDRMMLLPGMCPGTCSGEEEPVQVVGNGEELQFGRQKLVRALAPRNFLAAAS
jgi:hypothetical protein